MATVQSLLDDLQFRVDVNADLYHLINRAIRTIAKRLYYLKSDIIRTGLNTSIYASVDYTASTIAFVDGGASADTITDSVNGFVTAGFEQAMYIGTDATGNAGPWKLTTVAVGTLTLPTASVTAALAGTAVTITSEDEYFDLPSGFWGLVDQPYLDGKTYPLLPLPSEDVRLSYTSAGEPRYYQIKGNKIYFTPHVATDATLKGDYFCKPTEVTAVGDTLPFYELFDDAIGEALVRYYLPDGRFSVENLRAVQEFLFQEVDQIASKYGRGTPSDGKTGIDWENL
ncbi:MAG: hypothetical protein WC455_19895 [Dehalococcoidia bacterium]|jgi:hypothetical protein